RVKSNLFTQDADRVLKAVQLYVKPSYLVSGVEIVWLELKDSVGYVDAFRVTLSVPQNLCQGLQNLDRVWIYSEVLLVCLDLVIESAELMISRRHVLVGFEIIGLKLDGVLKRSNCVFILLFILEGLAKVVACFRRIGIGRHRVSGLLFVAREIGGVRWLVPQVKGERDDAHRADPVAVRLGGREPPAASSCHRGIFQERVSADGTR